MISLLLLFLATILFFIFERIGAIALELTGMPQEQAAFQALSAFSGVGFTTKEAEYALGHPQRRKIIKALIRFGSAGIITTMVAFIGTLLSSKSIFEMFSRDPRYSWMPFNFPTIILILVVVFFYFLYRALSQPSIARLVKEIISAALLKTKIVKPVSFQEILVNGNGSGVFQIEISENNPLVGKTPKEMDLKNYDICVLYVNRMSESIDFPPENFCFQLNDIATLYGPAVTIYDHCVELQAKVEIEKAGGKDAPLPVGAQAPEFSLADQNGRQISLLDFRDKQNLLVVFYPKDKSFFCTAQLKTLSGHLKEINALNTEVLAINQESVNSHAGFCDSSGLKFSLLADPSKKVCKVYKTVMLGGFWVDRTVYILDKKGIIRYAQRGKPAVTEVLAVLKQIQENAALAIDR